MHEPEPYLKLWIHPRPAFVNVCLRNKIVKNGNVDILFNSRFFNLLPYVGAACANRLSGQGMTPVASLPSGLAT